MSGAAAVVQDRGRLAAREASGRRGWRWGWLALAVGLALGGCQALLPKLQAPRVTVSGVGIQGGSLRAQQLQLFLNVQNPNDRSISVDSLVAHLDLIDMPFATGVSNAPFVLPARGATNVVLNVTADLRNALVIMAAGIAHSTVDYRVYGQVQLRHSLVHTLNFSHSGRVRL